MTPRDSGWYDCQVNAEPKLSAQAHLNVRQQRRREEEEEEEQANTFRESGWVRQLAAANRREGEGPGGRRTPGGLMRDSPARPLRRPGQEEEEEEVVLMQLASTTGIGEITFLLLFFTLVCFPHMFPTCLLSRERACLVGTSIPTNN